jgi:hypothetical protein
MDIEAFGDLGDIAKLGLTLSEAKQILARLQQMVVAVQADDHAVLRPDLPDCHPGLGSRPSAPEAHRQSVAATDHRRLGFHTGAVIRQRFRRPRITAGRYPLRRRSDAPQRARRCGQPGGVRDMQESTN